VTLVDTSIWIEDLVGFEEIVTCLPVVQEVLQGFREERHGRIAREALFAFPIVESPMEAAVFLEAASLYRSARCSGLAVRSSTDCRWRPVQCATTWKSSTGIVISRHWQA
jgi:predicted nucleic acid-binding protein